MQSGPTRFSAYCCCGEVVLSGGWTVVIFVMLSEV